MVLRIRLDARVDPRVADYCGVADPGFLSARGLFVAEGRLVVQRLVEDRRFRVRSILLSEPAFASLEPSLANLDSSVPVYVSSPDSMSDVVGFNVHRGCLALAERPAMPSLNSLLEQARVAVFAEGIADPSNLGAIFRNALAFGADALVLSPSSCDPLYRKAIRTSMAAALRVPFTRAERWPDALEACRSNGFTIAALTPHSSALELEAFVSNGRPNRLGLLLGSEGDGLTSAALQLADMQVRIPVAEAADSLNVAVAAGIALYRLRYTDLPG
jgi:tRNA G18 (ribose-2'-O)-methylase SpoU